MGVLENNPQRTAQGALLNIPHVDAVIEDASPLYIIKPVDEIGDGGLACTGGAHKGDLLPWLGIHTHISQHGVSRLVAEVHMLKAHIAPQGNILSRRLMPGPALPCLFQTYGSLINLGGLIHNLKDTLGTCQRSQQEVALLGKLIDGRGGLTHKDQIAGQTARVGHPFQGHNASQDRDNGVVDIRDGHYRRDHGSSIALGSSTCPAQGLVFLVKNLHAGLLVVEDLYHFLSVDHLLDITIQIAQTGLLFGVVSPAAAAAEADVGKHGRITHNHHQGQLPIEYKEQNQGARHLNEALDGHGKAVVQRIGDGVHVVGEVTHNIAVPAGIKEAQRQSLEVGKQIPPNIQQHLLGRPHHGLSISKGTQHADPIDDHRQGNALNQGLHISRHQRVDHRTNHVGTQQIGSSTDGHQHPHCQQQELVPSQVGEEGLYRIAQTLWLFPAEGSSHAAPLLSSEMRRSPGRWGHAPGAAGGFLPRGPCRHPG